MTFQIPIAVAVARVSAEFQLLAITCLDAPEFRTREIVRKFWQGVAHYEPARLVTFNGRGFDLPLLELAAFRYGLSVPSHFQAGRGGPRDRYGEMHLDLLDFLANRGAIRLEGGLNLLGQLLGKPTKFEGKGDSVYEKYRAGKLKEINEYCCFDVLDTYFVFLRTCVLTGELTLEREQQLVRESRLWLGAQALEQPHLQRYLDHWGDWEPWP